MPLHLCVPEEPFEIHTKEPSEIVLGIVAPLGTDGDKIRSMISNRLGEYGYDCVTIRISKVVIPAIAGPENVPTGSAYAIAMGLIDLGNEIRKVSKNNAVLAIASAAEIARNRASGKVQKRAYVISSLKHPEEVAELRKIYGNGFYLFAVHTDREKRIHFLMGPHAESMTEPHALELITRDEHEPEEHGQHIRDTFHLADFFLSDENDDEKLRHSIVRCLDLVFGSPTITPTFNEFAMFMAHAASLRSASLSRQVGAVVARNEEILSTGANDCPRPGGGLYWPTFSVDRVVDAPRGRDHMRDYDSNSFEKARLIRSIVDKFPVEQQGFARGVLEKSEISEITEYGRAVHAEMEALLACGRNGIACRRATLYCTTYPCHNCAKHIVAAGITQVIFIEPYPKSRAMELHDDALTFERQSTEPQNDAMSSESQGGQAGKVRFKPFVGVGPRQFFDLFSMSLSSGRPLKRKEPDGRITRWDASIAAPRVQMLPVSYIAIEEETTQYIKALKGGDGEHGQAE